MLIDNFMSEVGEQACQYMLFTDDIDKTEETIADLKNHQARLQQPQWVEE